MRQSIFGKVPAGALGVVVLVASGSPGLSQEAADRPTFDLASVRPSAPDGVFRGGSPIQPGGRFVVSNLPLHALIVFVHLERARQIVGGPEWIRTERFDIEAKAPADATADEIRLMVQELLADRFGLRVRRELRHQPVYRLVMARPDGALGPRLTHSPVDCSIRSGEVPAGPPTDPACWPLRLVPGRLTGQAVTMAGLASALSSFAGRVVTNETGLEGWFELDLEWTPERPPSFAPRGGRAGFAAGREDELSLFTAVVEQLGLRLEPATGPVEVLVIESVHRPRPD